MCQKHHSTTTQIPVNEAFDLIYKSINCICHFFMHNKAHTQLTKDLTHSPSQFQLTSFLFKCSIFACIENRSCAQKTNNQIHIWISNKICSSSQIQARRTCMHVCITKEPTYIRKISHFEFLLFFASLFFSNQITTTTTTHHYTVTDLLIYFFPYHFFYMSLVGSLVVAMFIFIFFLIQIRYAKPRFLVKKVVSRNIHSSVCWSYTHMDGPIKNIQIYHAWIRKLIFSEYVDVRLIIIIKIQVFFLKYRKLKSTTMCAHRRINYFFVVH